MQVPLRRALPDGHLWLLPHDLEAHERAFADSVERMRRLLHFASRLEPHVRIADVCNELTNFLVPHQNPMGRLFPRYDLRNPVFFVERLNAALETEVATFENAYLLDIDAIAAIHGRRYVQDDAIDAIGHGALWDEDPQQALDAGRIQPVPTAAEHYDFAPRDAFLAEETENNFPARELYARSGFARRGDIWLCDAQAVPVAPAHAKLITTESSATK